MRKIKIQLFLIIILLTICTIIGMVLIFMHYERNSDSTEANDSVISRMDEEENCEEVNTFITLIISFDDIAEEKAKDVFQQIVEIEGVQDPVFKTSEQVLEECDYENIDKNTYSNPFAVPHAEVIVNKSEENRILDEICSLDGVRGVSKKL